MEVRDREFVLHVAIAPLDFTWWDYGGARCAGESVDGFCHVIRGEVEDTLLGSETVSCQQEYKEEDSLDGLQINRGL